MQECLILKEALNLKEEIEEANNEKDVKLYVLHPFLYNENHAIVAWFKKRLTDEQITKYKLFQKANYYCNIAV